MNGDRVLFQKISLEEQPFLCGSSQCHGGLRRKVERFRKVLLWSGNKLWSVCTNPQLETCKHGLGFSPSLQLNTVTLYGVSQYDMPPSPAFPPAVSTDTRLQRKGQYQMHFLLFPVSKIA